MSKEAQLIRERHRKFPSIIEAAFLVIALFVAEYVVGAALRDFRPLSGMDPKDVTGVVTLLGNGILFSALLHYKRMSYASLFHPSSNSVRATLGTLSLPILLLIPALFLAMSAVTSFLVWLFPVSPWEESMFDRMMSDKFATVVTVCILAPFLEEMLFRGIILRSFLEQHARPRAFVYSAALFGLAHMNVYQFACGFTIGVILAWLYERSRSLWPCIFLHGAYNSLVTWTWHSSGSRAEQDLWEAPLLYWAAAFLFAFVGASFLRRLLGVGTSS
jgi:membrane protease YdiL (CAAX protease family)